MQNRRPLISLPTLDDALRNMNRVFLLFRFFSQLTLDESGYPRANLKELFQKESEGGEEMTRL